MKTKDIMRYVDDGADFYLRVIGNADHMEISDNGIYEMMRSRSDVNNLCSVYNIRVDGLSDEEMSKVIQDIKRLNVHTWWPCSDRVQDAVHGKDRNKDFWDGELYGAMLSEEMPKYPQTPNSVEVRRVFSSEEFQTWCELDNKLEHGGEIVIHPQNHYHLIINGKLRCYLGYVDNKAVTTTAILNNDGIGSLEFTTTQPENRQKGYAKAVCQVAIADAFKDGMKVISIRAIGNARMLGRSLGFTYIAPDDSVWNTSQNDRK